MTWRESRSWRRSVTNGNRLIVGRPHYYTTLNLTPTFLCPHPSSLLHSSLPSSFPSFSFLSLSASLSPPPPGLPPKTTLELQSLCELLSVELVFTARFTNVLSVFVYVKPKKAGVTSTLKINKESLVSVSRGVHLHVHQRVSRLSV